MSPFQIDFPGANGSFAGEDLKFLSLIKVTVLKNIGNPYFSVSDLSKATSLSTSQLARKLKTYSSCSPASVITHIRMQHATRLLLETQNSIKEIALATGFLEQSNFSRVFKRHFNTSPRGLRIGTGTEDYSFRIPPHGPVNFEEVNYVYTMAGEHPWLKKMLSVFNQHMTDPSFKTEQLASRLSLSPSQLHRKFKALFQLPLGQFLKRLRLFFAASILLQEEASIVSVAYRTGFFDHAHFTRNFKSLYKRSPKSYRKNQDRLALKHMRHLREIDKNLLKTYNF